MKTTITKKVSTFILLLIGMFSFSVADAQFICDCVPGHPAGYCYVDSHGNTKCHKIPHHCGGCTRLDQNESGMGIETSLQVYPNPVSTSTAISFSLEQSENVSLMIFDIAGRYVATVANEFFEAGNNELTWDASALNSGIYFLKIRAGSYSETRKIFVTK